VIELNIPKIPHANVRINERNRVVIEMHEDYSFYDRQSYEGIRAEEITFSKYGVFAPDMDFNSRIAVVNDADKIPETNEATESDYINALEDPEVPTKNQST
jgi:hypothetical protein